MKIFNEKEIVVKKKELIGVRCDKCGIDVKETRFDYYFEVTTAHSRWGNDSCDSTENKDFCSDFCLTAGLKDYLFDPEETDTFQVECTSKY